MYINFGESCSSQLPSSNAPESLVVESCGTYQLHNDPPLKTSRPNGRDDYQLLYIASGKSKFIFQNREEIMCSGSVVLYRPFQPQYYVHYSEEQTEVFWIHFTGKNVEPILDFYHLYKNRYFFSVNNSNVYRILFQRIIMELQLKRPMYEEMISTLLNGIFVLLSRQLSESDSRQLHLYNEIEQAVGYFNAHYREKISVERYAEQRHISKAWFIRNFKAQTGSTPLDYLVSLRIANAQELLLQTDYSVKKIAAVVGYDNPLYFSRVFSKKMGTSPLEYRKKYCLPPNSNQKKE